MKKLISVLIVLIMVASLAACSKTVTVEHGEINANVYTNESAGITFKCPENWAFADDSVLLSFSENEKYTKLTSDVQNEILEDSGLAFDMMCTSSEDEACSIGIMFANTNFSEIEDFTFEDILYNMTGGLDVSTSESSTVKLGEEEYEKYSISSMNQQTGKPLYATFYGRQDHNIIYIIVASYTDAITDKNIENCFS